MAAAPAPTLAQMTDEQARLLTLVMLGSAAFLVVFIVLIAVGVFPFESPGVVMLVLGLGAVTDLAFVGYLRWRRGQAAQP